jgi:MYXO-CTERM domain-containing protein
VNVSVTFGNLGTAPATGVTYSLALPPGLTGVSCVGATCSYDSNTGSVTVTGLPGTLAPGQTVDITLNYTAPTSGSVTVTAGANAGNDSNPNNNSASGRTVIIGAPVDIPALTPTALLALLALLLLAGWRTIDQTARRRTRG